VGALLALASATCYGAADFAGGLLSRRAHYAATAVFGQAGSLIFAIVVAAATTPARPGLSGLAWGALSGMGSGAGMLFLYRGMSHGTMSVVVPVSAVTGITLPVLAAVAFLGDRPSALSWAGIAVGVPALWLVSRTGTGTEPATSASLDGLIAGIGIAVQYVALAQAPPQAGLWPVAAGRLTATLAILPLAVYPRVRLRLPTRLALPAAATGAAAALALMLYLLATRRQLVAIAVVLSSLYPAIPVVLGIATLHERLTRAQITGLVAAATAIALLTTK
jgi:drug/metabolite transporter (DMT)-like permease